MSPRGYREAQEWRRLNISLTPDQHDWVEAHAEERRTSIAGILRLALDEYRERVDPQQTLPL